jgi:hypothetical protein
MDSLTNFSDFLIHSQIDQAPTNPSKAEHAESILTFLAVAQSQSVDFLPISPQRLLGSVGRGASGDISQSSILKDLGLAFKEFSALSGSHETLMKSMIREIRILQHRPIQLCTNIINLEGICWKSDGSEAGMSPVLVYRLGRSLASHLAETPVAFETRLQYVKNIGNGLLVLHASGQYLTKMTAGLTDTSRSRPRRSQTRERHHEHRPLCHATSRIPGDCRLWKLTVLARVAGSFLSSPLTRVVCS